MDHTKYRKSNLVAEKLTNNCLGGNNSSTDFTTCRPKLRIFALLYLLGSYISLNDNNLCSYLFQDKGILVFLKCCINCGYNVYQTLHIKENL